MKKTNYVATIYYKSGGEIIETQPLSGAVAESIVAQANAGQTIHMFDGSVEYIIPWESVVEVQYRRITEDVEAPIDAICNDGGEAQGRLVVTAPSELGPLERINEGGSCKVSVPTWTPTITYDGQAVDPYDFMTDGGSISVEGAEQSEGRFYISLDCDADSATYTTVFSYKGDTCEVTVTQRVVGGEG